jgi:hypothetical protein
MAASSPAIGAFALAGRLWQCGQQLPAVIAARARMEVLSRRMTSSEPSFRILRVLKGTDLAPFFTRRRSCAPVPEKRLQRSVGKKPRPGCRIPPRAAGH